MDLQPIERHFKRAGFRARLRASVLAPYWNDFVEDMEGVGAKIAIRIECLEFFDHFEFGAGLMVVVS